MEQNAATIDDKLKFAATAKDLYKTTSERIYQFFQSVLKDVTDVKNKKKKTTIKIPNMVR